MHFDMKYSKYCCNIFCEVHSNFIPSNYGEPRAPEGSSVCSLRVNIPWMRFGRIDSTLSEGKQWADEWQIPLQTNGQSLYGTEIGSVTGECMSRCSGQLGLQNVMVAECPALSIFMETQCLIDGGTVEQIMCPPRHVNQECRPQWDQG